MRACVRLWVAIKYLQACLFMRVVPVRHLHQEVNVYLQMYGNHSDIAAMRPQLGESTSRCCFVLPADFFPFCLSAQLAPRRRVC